jgi:hypothetical protein
MSKKPSLQDGFLLAAADKTGTGFCFFTIPHGLHRFLFADVVSFRWPFPVSGLHFALATLNAELLTLNCLLPTSPYGIIESG